MPKRKKILLPQNLATYDVYIEDTSEDSEYFNISRLPQSFTGGRNSFLIGGSYYLQDGSEILIEILDSTGNPIYNSMVQNYIEGNSRMMSVEIYDTTPAGFSTIIIMAKAIRTSTGQPIPAIWNNTYNVRWTKRVLVDYDLKNISPIKFLNSPQISVSENRFYNVNSSSYNTNTTTFTASLTPNLTYGRQTGYSINAISPTTFSADYYNGIITGSIKIGTNSTDTITLPITKILNDSTAFSYGYLIPSSINNGIITNIYLKSGSYTTPLYGQNYSITASAKIQYSTINTASVNIPISYANLRISNLNTVSGEIYKCRVYTKVATNTADYKLVGDVYVNTSEILVTSSIRGNLPIGDIYSTKNYNDNWYAGSLEKNTSIRTQLYTISGSSTYYDSTINTNKLAVSSSNDILLSSIYGGVPIDISTNKFSNKVSESGYFIGTKNGYTLYPTSEYTLTLDAFYKKTSGSITLGGNTPRVDIYLVGTDGSTVISNNPLGQKIGELIVLSDVQWYEQKQFNFFPAINTAGNLALRLVISNGFWNISNISLKPATDAQFAPDEIQMFIPNTEYHTELLQYKVEFFDINNNSPDINAISTPVFFTGSAIDLGTLR